MRITATEKNKSLLITADNLGRRYISNLRKNCKNFNHAWDDIAITIEGEMVMPEDIGALTASPIMKFKEKLYWIPDYMVRDELSELARKGRIFMTEIEVEK